MFVLTSPFRSPKEPSSGLESDRPERRVSWHEMLNDAGLDPESRIFAAEKIARHVSGLVTSGGLDAHYPGIFGQTCEMLVSPETPHGLRLPLSRLLLECIRITSVSPPAVYDPVGRDAHKVCLTNAGFLLRHMREHPDPSLEESTNWAELIEAVLAPYVEHSAADSKELLGLFDAKLPTSVQASLLNALCVHLISAAHVTIDEPERKELVNVARQVCASALVKVLAPSPDPVSSEQAARQHRIQCQASRPLLISSVTAGILLGDRGTLEFIDLVASRGLLGLISSIRARLSDALKRATLNRFPGVEALTQEAIDALPLPSY